MAKTTNGAARTQRLPAASDAPGGQVQFADAGGRVRAGQFIALMCSAILFGLTLAHVLQSPGSRGLTGSEWLAVQHTFYGGFAIVGGASEVLGLITTAFLAVALAREGGMRRAVAPAIAALCFLGALLSYWLGNRPVNDKVAGWTRSTLPANWESYRSTWEDAHALTAALAAIAFLVLASALVWRRGSR